MVWKRGGSRHRNYPLLRGQVSAETQLTEALAQNRSLAPAASLETQGALGTPSSSQLGAPATSQLPTGRPPWGWWAEGSWVMALIAV